MTADKWRFIGGKVFRLVGEYERSVDAIRKATEIAADFRVHISRTTDGTWIVYWRAREEETACKPSHYRIV